MSSNKIVNRILFISPELYPCIKGGMEIFNYYFIREIAKSGYKIMIFTICPNIVSKNVILFKMNRKLLVYPNLSISVQILFNLLKVHNSIDLICIPYTSNSYLPYPLLIFMIFFNIPYIIIIHGGGLHQWKHKKLLNYFFCNSSQIIGVSSEIKKEYEARTGKKVLLIPPLIPFKISRYSKNDLRTKYNFKERDKIIIYIGSLKEIKGVNLLLKAFANLSLNFIKKNYLKLLFVGEGPQKSVMENHVTEYSLDNYVKFLGEIPHKKISEIYKLADIYIIPSLFEGRSISLMEAMFNGLTIIGSDVNGINSLIINYENGILFKSKDIKDLKRKIIELVCNKDLSLKLGQKAKEFATSFDYENLINEYEDIFKGISDS